MSVIRAPLCAGGLLAAVCLAALPAQAAAPSRPGEPSMAEERELPLVAPPRRSPGDLEVPDESASSAPEVERTGLTDLSPGIDAQPAQTLFAVKGGVFGGMSGPFSLGPILSLELGRSWKLGPISLGLSGEPLFVLSGNAQGDASLSYWGGAAASVSVAGRLGPGSLRGSAGGLFYAARASELAQGTWIRRVSFNGGLTLGAQYVYWLGQHESDGVVFELRYGLLGYRTLEQGFAHALWGGVGYARRW